MSGAGAVAGSDDSGRQDDAPQQALAPIFDLRSSSPLTTSVAAKKNMLKFPEKCNVPSAVQAAITSYEPPEGHYVAHPARNNPSIIHFWGVRLDTTPEEDWQFDDKGKPKERAQLFVCMADDSCRTKGTSIKITNRQTSSATNHLDTIHSVKSERTKAADSRAVEIQDELETARSSSLFTTDPTRYLTQEYVKAFPVHAASPFNLAEHEPIRRFFSLMRKGFDVKSLNNKAVKRMMIEMYHATTREFKQSMGKTLRKAVLPILHLNADLWTCKVSGLKYIGVRVFYLDDKMNVRTHLLAIRAFRQRGKHTGEVSMKWIRQVLRQHGIRHEDIAAAVTDAGGDIRRGVSLAWCWEWCLAHLLNRATIDGTGMSLAKANSKNLQCRELLEVIKKMVEHFNKSVADKIALEDIIDELSEGKKTKAKLSQAVAQRWISICKMLLRVLERWDALKTFYVDNEKSGNFRLNGKKNEVEEVYTIVNAVKEVVVYSQTTYVSTAQGGLQRLVLLATSTLEKDRPLKIKHVQAIGQKEKVPPSLREHKDLTKVGATTREAFAQGVASRFVSPRYGKGLSTHSHRFDMANFLSPGMRGLKYVDTLELSSVGKLGGCKPADEVKAVIIGQVRTLLVEGIKYIRARPKDASPPAPPDAPRAKRLKTAGGTPSESRLEEFSQEGIMDSSSDEEAAAASEAYISPEQEATRIISEWKTRRIDKEHKKLDGVDYWREHGDEWPEVVRGLAQAVFGAPSSAGIMERDFCIADMFQPRKRGGMEPAYLEMGLYLRDQLDNIPKDVPKLSDEEQAKAIPTRFTDRDMLDEVVELDCSFEPVNDECDADDEDLSWIDGEEIV